MLASPGRRLQHCGHHSLGFFAASSFLFFSPPVRHCLFALPLRLHLSVSESLPSSHPSFLLFLCEEKYSHIYCILHVSSLPLFLPGTIPSHHYIDCGYSSYLKPLYLSVLGLFFSLFTLYRSLLMFFNLFAYLLSLFFQLFLIFLSQCAPACVLPKVVFSLTLTCLTWSPALSYTISVCFGPQKIVY